VIEAISSIYSLQAAILRLPVIEIDHGSYGLTENAKDDPEDGIADNSKAVSSFLSKYVSCQYEGHLKEHGGKGNACSRSDEVKCNGNWGWEVPLRLCVGIPMSSSCSQPENKKTRN